MTQYYWENADPEWKRVNKIPQQDQNGVISALMILFIIVIGPFQFLKNRFGQ